MTLLRRVLGETLRSRRLRQRRTLREVSSAARVSLGYLSEVERGQKEASSELLAAICAALGVRLSDLLREVSDSLVYSEAPVRRVPVPPRRELAGVGPRHTAPMQRLPVPRDGVSEDLEQALEDGTWEAAPAKAPAGQRPDPGAAERPLEPVGTDQVMFDRFETVPFPVETVPFPVESPPFTVEGIGGEQPCPELDAPILDGQVVPLPARCAVVAAA